MLRSMNVFFSVLLSLTCTSVCGQTLDARYRPRQVLKSPMPALTKPNIIKGTEADVPPNALVLGVDIDGEARAYLINELTGPHREVINDRLNGVPIAATW